MRWMIIVALTLFGAACQSEDPAQPPTGTPPVTRDTAEAYMAPVPADDDTTKAAQPQENYILQDVPVTTNSKEVTPGYERLVGSWTTKARRATIVSIYADGRLNIEAEGWPTVKGTFTMRGNRLSMQTSSDLMCKNVVGVYDVYYAPDWNTLFFEKIQDDCDMRGKRLRKSFTRVSDTPGVDPAEIEANN